MSEKSPHEKILELNDEWKSKVDGGEKITMTEWAETHGYTAAQYKSLLVNAKKMIAAQVPADNDDENKLMDPETGEIIAEKVQVIAKNEKSDKQKKLNKKQKYTHFEPHPDWQIGKNMYLMRVSKTHYVKFPGGKRHAIPAFADMDIMEENQRLNKIILLVSE